MFTHSPTLSLKAGELKDEMREDDGVIAERLAAQHDAPTYAEIPPRSTAGVFICAPEMAARSRRDSRREAPTPIQVRRAEESARRAERRFGDRILRDRDAAGEERWPACA